jgi:hypothetical protein
MATQAKATELLDNAQIAIKISHTFESPCLGTVSWRTSKKHTQKEEDSIEQIIATRHIDWAPKTNK